MTMRTTVLLAMGLLAGAGCLPPPPPGVVVHEEGFRDEGQPARPRDHDRRGGGGREHHRDREEAREGGGPFGP